MAWSLPNDCVLGILGSKPEPGKLPQFREGEPRLESISSRAAVEARPRRSIEGRGDHLKNGLVAEWGVEAAAVLQQAMLFDTLDTWDSESVLAPGGRRVLVYAPSDAGPWFDALLPASFALQPQFGGDPGQCLQAFMSGELEEGASRVVVIGSDSPTIDPTILVSAFLCLEGRDLVLGRFQRTHDFDGLNAPLLVAPRFRWLGECYAMAKEGDDKTMQPIRRYLHCLSSRNKISIRRFSAAKGSAATFNRRSA